MKAGTYKHTAETRAKIRASLKGRNSGMLGKRHSEATKEKIRAATLGKKKSPTQCENMRIAMKNRPIEVIERIAATNRARKYDPERMAEMGRRGLLAASRNKGPTSIERAVMHTLERMGVTYFFQHPIGRYTTDFYLPKYRLIIEADGAYFHSLPRTIEVDARKNANIAERGYQIARIGELAIRENVEDAVNDAIRAAEPGAPKLFAMTPFGPEKNLGKAYNDAMKLLPEYAWAIFLDHDALFTTSQWYSQFAEAIAFLPHAGAIVAMANRIGPAWQRCGPAGDDIREHRRFGAERLKVRTLLDVTDTKGWGGVCFAVSKAAWQEVGGFIEGFMGCTDHDLFFKLQRAGRRSYVHQGIYLFHSRISSEARPPVDMNQVPGCPCRGAELAPSARVTLP